MTMLREAQDILKLFEFDDKRTNEMAGRTLLSLLNLTENDSWADADNPRIGVRGIMDWMRNSLDKNIAENSRETVRRFVLHQFVDSGFCLHNDDDPLRPTNSSKNVYRVSPNALRVIRLYDPDPQYREEFQIALEEYLADSPSQLAQQQAAREMARIPVTMPDGVTTTLKAGGQNNLIKAMVEEFCEYFIPGGEILYIGDADDKTMLYKEKYLEGLGVSLNLHGKMPDLVVYQHDKNWLLLMEAASTHGPVDTTRYLELKKLFAGSTAGLVFVSCFPNRKTMRKFLADLAWETEAWVASDPTHMIHLNGSRFIGPYDD